MSIAPTPSLQYLALKEVLAAIPIDDETSPAIDEFILEYIKGRKSAIISKMLVGSALVYYRLRDPAYIKPWNNDQYTDKGLIQICATKTAAKRWIAEKGRELYESLEDEFRDPVAFFIVEVDADTFSYDEYRFDCVWNITCKHIDTYVFSSEGREMVLREWKECFLESHSFYDAIPTWIYHYSEKGLIRGCSAEELEVVLAETQYIHDGEKKEEFIREALKVFHSDPDNYDMKSSDF